MSFQKYCKLNTYYCGNKLQTYPIVSFTRVKSRNRSVTRTETWEFGQLCLMFITKVNQKGKSATFTTIVVTNLCWNLFTISKKKLNIFSACLHYDYKEIEMSFRLCNIHFVLIICSSEIALKDGKLNIITGFLTNLTF